MICSTQLLRDLQKRVRVLEEDLRKRCEADPAVNAPLQKEYEAPRAKGRTAITFNAWREEELTQVAVAWILGWLKQWHNELNPDYGMALADYFADFLDEEARKQGTTVEALKNGLTSSC